MTKTQKKTWRETGYRCYVRSMGPILIEVYYSCVSQSFKAVLEAPGQRQVIATLFNELHDTCDSDDRMVLRIAERKAKTEIRSWTQ